MKNLKNLMLAIAVLASLTMFSCKDKTETETTTETEHVETAVDNTAVDDTVTAPPAVTDTVPGVNSGMGDEQVP